MKRIAPLVTQFGSAKHDFPPFIVDAQ